MARKKDRLDALTTTFGKVADSLKPCPFCGRQPQLVITGGGMTSIQCPSDGMDCITPRTGYYGRAPRAIEDWNKRAK